MAKIYPSFDLKKLRPRLTEGEETLVTFLKNNLDDTFEIFIQPFLNGDRPDIVLMRRNSGVMIFEVKDWNLKNFYLDKRRNWIINNSKVLSPIQQVLTYKENLFNLHIENLLEQNIKEPKNWGLVNCALYFHKTSTQLLKEFILKDSNEKYQKFISHFDLLGNDALTSENLKSILKKRKLDRNSYYFDKKLYDSFKKFLQPPQHTLDQGIEIPYTPEQLKLSVSENKEQKIKGVAGCGKTIVLSRRAVNAHKRTQKRVLILTYNITLINYIHDRISEIRENFDWTNFYIINYHDFITTEMNNCGIKFEMPEDFDNWDKEKKSLYMEKNWYSNEKLFEAVKDSLQKYDGIFIDEVQDYKIQWLRIIKKYFLLLNGEYVLFGDEKQNIYKQEMDSDKKPRTNVLGKWNQELNKTFRLSNKAAKVAEEFQRFYFSKKYEIDTIEIPFKSQFEEKFIYKNIGKYDLDEILSFIKLESEKIKAHPNDICVLAETIETLKELDSFIRHSSNQKTQTMFETKEVDIKLFFDYKIEKDTELVKEGIQKFNGRINDLILSLCYWEYLNYESAQINFNQLLSNSNFDINEFRSWKEKLDKLPKERKNIYENKIDLIRKNKKRNFRMNPGFVKLSTIHSFKGWEVKNLFIIIENHKQNEFITPELMYTAITRCRFNLFILNLGNKDYHNFFSKLEIN